MVGASVSLDRLCGQALAAYSVRILDNLDLAALERLPAVARARVIAGKLMESADARGFALARRILDEVENGAY